MRTIKPLRQKVRFIITFVFFLFFPLMFYYMSPALSICAANAGILNASLIFFIILFLVSLFLGRAYCGWVCPGGAIGDIYSFVNNKPIKHRWIKYIFWIPWFTVITILFIKSGGIKDIRILFNMENQENQVSQKKKARQK